MEGFKCLNKLISTKRIVTKDEMNRYMKKYGYLISGSSSKRTINIKEYSMDFIEKYSITDKDIEGYEKFYKLRYRNFYGKEIVVILGKLKYDRSEESHVITVKSMERTDEIFISSRGMVSYAPISDTGSTGHLVSTDELLNSLLSH